MSEQAVEGTEPEAIELPTQGDAAFGALMDALAPEESAATATAGGEATDAAAAGDGSAAPAGEGSAATDAATGTPAAGADGQPVVPGAAAESTDGTAGADAAGAGRPAEWTVPASEITPRLGELSTALEAKVTKGLQADALADVRKEHGRYFEQIEKHPRLLIGQEVPKIGGADGEMETLRDSKDAEEWQAAVKSVLVDEVRDRAGRAMEANSTFLTTLHSSIELFQNNADLVPGTKDFDVELANKLTTLLAPYELRVEGKLQGYSIPTQPIINQLRTDLTTSRATKAAPSAASTQARDKPTGQFTKEDQPQAGLTSKAGESGGGENFDTLFGTLGLSGIRI